MSGETFADLLAPALPALRKLVTGKMRRSDHSEDVVQQTLLQAFIHRHQLRTHSKFKSWLSSIAMNEIRMLARQTRLSIGIDQLPALACPSAFACPYRAYERKERAQRLHAGLERLGDRDRSAIHLIDLEDFKISEAADVLSVSPAALKSRHFRASQRLRQAIRTAPDAPANGQRVDARAPNSRELR